MKLTPEQLKTNAAAMIAHADGKSVQFSSPGNPSKWNDCDGFPTWMFRDGFQYRPKPDPSPRAWSNPDDVPGPICWIRPIGKIGAAMIIRISEKSIAAVGGDIVLVKVWEELCDIEYSTDRKTWKPCVIEE